MSKKTIKLSTQEDLSIFMSPQRQRLIRNMRIINKPVTSKAVADMLGVSTSSAQFHIKKLEKLGILELDHTEKINGIIAKYYKLANVNVSIGSNFDDLANERYIVMENLVKGTFEGLIDLYKLGLPDEKVEKNSEFVNGFINLKPEDAQELLGLIREFIESHDKGEPGTQPWEYTLMLYNTEAKKDLADGQKGN